MKKEIKDLFYGVIFCIIIDAVYVTIAIYHEAPVSDYILMSIFLPIVDVAFLVFGSLCLKEESENKCLVLKLPDAVDDDKLPKLK